jgi:hypothetical protein
MQVKTHVVAFDDEVRVVVPAGELHDKHAAQQAIADLPVGGETGPQRLAAVAAAARQHGITSSTIGIGMGYDELLERGRGDLGM